MVSAVGKGGGPSAQAGPAGGDGYMAPWIDTNECTACGECIQINAKVFAYNDKKQAYIVDPKAGAFKDLVRSAEKCTARCIHPGLPATRTEKGIEKLIKRAEKFN
jgi:pyruvate-ferredoxin/flavodoxin oxidoreductase